MRTPNNHQQNRPVTYSHYTKSRRTNSQSKPDKPATTSETDKKTDRINRKSIQHSPLGGYFINHIRTFVSTLGKLYRTPLSTLMTTTVIGIALALPAGLFILLQNAQQLSASWDNGTQISVFLKQDMKDPATQELINKIQSNVQIKEVQFISAAQALDEFREKSGFDDALALLNENPLPSLLMVSLVDPYPDENKVSTIMNYLSELVGVDNAQLDMQWLARLNALIRIGQRGSLIVAALLGLAILVIVGNTIRLTIQGRRQEIEVSKLIGATDGFIRRPFLYSGLWYGLIGGIIAWGLVFVSMFLLQTPVKDLSALYGSDFALAGLGGQKAMTLLLIGITLGWLGSWVSVQRHLHEIEPK